MKGLEIESFGRICYGFTKGEAEQVCINKQQAEVVSMLFEKYLEGFSLGRLSELLQSNHIPSPSGRETWTRTTIDKLLSNQSYVPHIIPWDQFYRVQDEKMRRCNLEYGETDVQRKSTRYNSTHILSGLLVCAECGANYRRITRPTGEIVWRCANRVEHGSKICKHSPSITETDALSFLQNNLHITQINAEMIRNKVSAIYVTDDEVCASRLIML